jgi:hypothetical protein
MVITSPNRVIAYDANLFVVLQPLTPYISEIGESMQLSLVGNEDAGTSEEQDCWQEDMLTFPVRSAG